MRERTVWIEKFSDLIRNEDVEAVKASECVKEMSAIITAPHCLVYGCRFGLYQPYELNEDKTRCVTEAPT
ncbi:hypothetical protein EVAR_5727_1 [Eumeta japonica]|uniref:Uncharacterized protein n=1 Tax=Eumeta variegata TaxID=151549 RepID=A0A4C1TAU7_EUMVA|nr:hypothetical protein EVAR_5727_1 [Eumeta japonica]